MMGRRLFGLVVVVTLALVFARPDTSVAQESDPEFYGTQTNIHYVSAEEFVCSDHLGNCAYEDCGDNFWCNRPSGDYYAQIYATVRLPAGALIQGFRVVYDDTESGFAMSVRFFRSYNWGLVKGTEQIKVWTTPAGTPGLTTTWVDIDPDYTVVYRYWSISQYGYCSYFFWVTMPPAEGYKLRGILVYWKRQISPAPASQTFPDVAPGYWAFQEIEALAASGITTGFPDGTYRPTDPVTRAQMATFMARALGLHWAP